MLTLRQQINAFLLLIFAATILVVGVVHWAFQQERLNTVVAKVDLLLDTLVDRDHSALANELFGRRERAIALRIEAMAAVEGVVGIAVYDQTNQLIVSQGDVVLEPQLPIGDSMAVLTDNVHFQRQIKVIGDHLGTIVIAYSLADVRAELTKSWLLLGAYVLALAVALFVLLQFLVTRSILRPVNSLMHGLERVGQGEVGAQVTVAVNNEIGVLAGRFNQMSVQRATAEEALRRSEAQVRRILDALVESVLVVNDEDVVTECNPAALTLGEWSRADVIGRPIEDLFADVGAEWNTDLIRRMSSQQKLIEVSIKDGERIALMSSGQLDGGRVIVMRDISQLRELENMVSRGEKMQAIGQLAGGIAHDFNNVIAAILGLSEMQMQMLDSKQPAYRHAKSIARASERAASLTSRLLTFSRQGARKIESFDLRDVMQDGVTLLRAAVDPRVEIHVQASVSQAFIEGDRSQLQAALLNLGVNARDAMPDGGLITIKLDAIDLSQKDCQQEGPGIKPGSYFRLTVSDQGPGVPDDIRDRIFEPFFTTKDVGAGTGLGLAAVYGTVADFNGSIQVKAAAEGGAEFVILLPQAVQPRLDVQSGENDVPRGNGLVLVVDDEPIVRDVGRMHLESLGYVVHDCENGQQALERCEKYNFDVILLDTIMPIMNGIDCFRALRQTHPQMQVVLCSGYAEDLPLAELKEQGLSGFLAKPYRRSELAQAIAQAAAVAQKS